MSLEKIIFFIFLQFFISLNLLAYPQIDEAIKDKKIYPMGKKIYDKKCHKRDLTHFETYEALYQAVATKHICGDLQTKHAQMLALYVWDVQKKKQKVYEKITVSKEDKCQVCGMYLHYYPNWVCRINYPKAESYSFDGIKDMMKFYFNNKEGIVDILVQDYYTLKTLDARKAFYVIGSDVYGPMGHELIAFSTKEKAEDFSMEHKGKKVLDFDSITRKIVYSLE